MMRGCASRTGPLADADNAHHLTHQLSLRIASPKRRSRMLSPTGTSFRKRASGTTRRDGSQGIRYAPFSATEPAHRTPRVADRQHPRAAAPRWPGRLSRAPNGRPERRLEDAGSRAITACPSRAGAHRRSGLAAASSRGSLPSIVAIERHFCGCEAIWNGIGQAPRLALPSTRSVESGRGE